MIENECCGVFYDLDEAASLCSSSSSLRLSLLLRFELLFRFGLLLSLDRAGATDGGACSSMAIILLKPNSANSPRS
jgi:hypothetical protein